MATSIPDLKFEVLAQTELKSFIASIQNAVDTYFPSIAKNVAVVLDSSPTVNLAFTALKNAPYVLAADALSIDDWYHAMSSRIRFGEAAAMSFASMVHNFFMACLYSLLVTFTCGRNTQFMEECRKYWIHTAMAAASLGVSTLGVVSPTLGFSFTASYVLLLGTSVAQGVAEDISNGSEKFQKDVIAAATDLFSKFREGIEEALKRKCKESNGLDLYQRTVQPILQDFYKHLKTAQNFGDFLTAGQQFLKEINKVPEFTRNL